jgi:transposase-like protein
VQLSNGSANGKTSSWPGSLGAQLTAGSPDLLLAMVKTFADALMSAEADALCNAEYGAQ